MLTYILFAAGFVLLIKGADILVQGATSLAKKWNVSDMVIGLTIVSFGTSMPELVVNVLASLEGNSAIALGNILGSNICNILLILGVSSIICPLVIQKNTIFSEIPFSIIAALLLGFLANASLLDDEKTLRISRLDGGILLFFFILFMAYIVYLMKHNPQDQDQEKTDETEIMPVWKASAFIVGGIIGLYLGGEWIVNGAVEIAKYFGMSQSMIGLTIVAIGTSLPELVTSVVAAYKKNADIAVGNVVGSNIFNIFWILGISALINPLPFESISNLDIAMTIFCSTLILFFVIIKRNRNLSWLNGILFISTYVAYIIMVVNRG